MDFATINQLNTSMDLIWQYIIGVCLLSTALLSLGFILAVIGGALWQTVADARSRLRRDINFTTRRATLQASLEQRLQK